MFSEELDPLDTAAKFAEMTTALVQQDSTIGLLLESIAELEQDSASGEWMRLSTQGREEFSAEGLRRIVTVCQILAIKSPLIARACQLRASYTWGQGCTITAKDPRVDKVVQEFISDEANQAAWFSPSARVRMDRAAATDDNLWIAAFTDPMSGFVTLATVPHLQIGAVIRNPENRSDPWFYRVDSMGGDFDARSGLIQERNVSVWHPAMGRYHPGRPRVPRIGDWPVRWDAPMLHAAEHRPDGWTFGVPITYTAADYAMAYRDFLGDLATLARALSRFAWKQTGPGRKQAAARAALAAPPTLDPQTGNPLFAGATAMLGPDQRLESVSKAGAMIDKDTGSVFVNMVAAPFGFPVTMLLGDPSRGDRSAADNLDRPTELGIELHQDWCRANDLTLIHYAIDAAALAPMGPTGRLRGKIVRGPAGRERVVLANDRDRTVTMSFPSLDDITPAAFVDAIVKGAQTGTMHPFLTLEMLAKALPEFPDVERAKALVTDDAGEFKAPPNPMGKGADTGPSQSANPADPDPDRSKPAPRPDKDPGRVAAGAQGGSQAPESD